MQLDLDRIQPNLKQPRQSFDPETLEELARSMKRDGVLQPIIVRSAGDGFELIAGERRWRAAQMAGLLKIPALVKEVEDDRRLEIALVENLQREDLNPLDSAEAFRTLIDDLGLTQQDVAARVGKQRATVANLLRLLTLPRVVRDKIRAGDLSTGHAKALASLGSAKLQIKLAERVARGELSVRQLEAIVKRAQVPPEATQVVKRDPRDPNVKAAEKELQTALGTKVSIVQGKVGGRIELHFFSVEEMERVYQIVLKAAQSST